MCCNIVKLLLRLLELSSNKMSIKKATSHNIGSAFGSLPFTTTDQVMMVAAPPPKQQCSAASFGVKEGKVFVEFLMADSRSFIFHHQRKEWRLKIPLRDGKLISLDALFY